MNTRTLPGKYAVCVTLFVAMLGIVATTARADSKSAASAQADKPVQHELVVIDEGRDTLFYLNERDPSKNWLLKTDLPKMRDMQLIGDGRILVGYDKGYVEYNLADGKMLKKYDALKEVTSVRRQPDGSTLVAGVNLNGKKGICVLTLDKADKITNTAVFEGDYVRLVRQTEQGTYLLACGGEIREGSADGRYLKKYPVEGFRNMWKAVRLPNKHIIASAGYGGFMVELDPRGKIVRKWGAKGQVPDAVNPNFAATFQLLPNGNVVLANWQGHGPDHGKSGVQLLEYDKDGKIVWQWSKADMISSLQGVLVLDGLDTSKLHDERDGVMKPLAGCCSAKSCNAEAGVAAAVEKLRAAMLSAKAADLNAIAADNLLYGHSSGRLETKAEFVDTIVSGRSVFVTIDLSAQQIKVTGDTAIVRHTFEAKTNDGGKPGSVKIGIMLAWQKQNGEWKLLGRQAFKI